MKKHWHKICYVLRNRSQTRWQIKRMYWTVQGASIGKQSQISSRLKMTWPHQVAIGQKCIIEHNVFLNFNGIWKQGPSIIIGNNVFIGSDVVFNIRKGIRIGNNSLIASGSKFIDHDHGTKKGNPMNTQEGTEKGINIEDDVWLGCNVIVLKGVRIGKGAVVAAGAVVTKSIPDYEIWAGIPAQKISERI